MIMKQVLYISSSGKRGQKQSKKGSKSNAFHITNRTKNKVSGKEKVGTVMKPKDKDLNMKYDISSSLSMNAITKKLHKTLGIIDDPSQNSLYNWNMSLNYYNRFKLPTTNDMLQKGFAHVFFVRPDCNILSNGKATSSVMNNQFFAMQAKRSPGLLKELVLNNGKKHDFMLSLSNKVASFSLADEYINSDTYGKGYTGYKIAYGKNNIESKTAGQLSITFNDDRNGHVYQLIRAWTEYISGVYRGEIIPKESTIMNKILDYSSAIYYIVTAEDNETIIFWSKYYGVFPTQIPSDQYAWAQGNVIQTLNPTIQFVYSFKEDYNPKALVEFNANAGVGSGTLTYAPTFDKNLGHVGATWVGAPFIETLTGSSTGAECPYTLKLRFRE